MAHRICCPECDTTYYLKQELSGKTVRCKKCKTSFEVTPIPNTQELWKNIADRSACYPKTSTNRAMEAQDVKQGQRRVDNGASFRFTLTHVFAGAGALVAVTICLTVLIVKQSSSPTDTKPLEKQAIEEPLEKSRTREVQQSKPSERQVSPTPDANDQIVSNTDAKKEHSRASSAEPQKTESAPLGSNSPNVRTSTSSKDWLLEPDPAAEEAILPSEAAGSVPLLSNFDRVIFPPRLSPFIIIDRLTLSPKGPKDKAYEVWDLRTMNKAGVYIPPSFVARKSNISVDGKLLALESTPSYAKPLPIPFVEIWSVGISPQLVAHIDIDHERGKFPSINWFDFVGNDKLIVNQQVSTADIKVQNRVQIWDIKTKVKACQFFTPAPRCSALSNNGKYLAVSVDKEANVLIYETSTGKLVEQLSIPGKGFGTQIAFSADGISLFSGDDSRIVCWDVTNGKLRADYQFSKHLNTLINRKMGCEGNTIEWLSDSSGWVAYGQLLIDAEKGRIIKKLNLPSAYDHTSRRLFGQSKLAHVKVLAPNHRELVIENVR